MTIRTPILSADKTPLTAWEFFAGGGLAGLGLAHEGFKVTWANDIDPAKARTFVRNFPHTPLQTGDVWQVRARDLPGTADLAWASFPCQDVSLAGPRGGLDGTRSGTFWGFWQKVLQTRAEGCGPRAVVLENVLGLMSSHEGRDFQMLCEALVEDGYEIGALVIDAVHWLPQSRPRLFVVALEPGLSAPQTPGPTAPWHTERLKQAVAALPPSVHRHWHWWALPTPPVRHLSLSDLLDRTDTQAGFDDARTHRLLSHLAPVQRQRLDDVRATGKTVTALGYVRMRREDGRKVQRLELRFDGVAGCLRTPAGGSSRQYVVSISKDSVTLRYLSAREAARLMGLSESYVLPGSETAGLKLMGDAVAVPAVRALAAGLLRPALLSAKGVDRAT